MESSEKSNSSSYKVAENTASKISQVAPWKILETQETYIIFVINFTNDFFNDIFQTN